MKIWKLGFLAAILTFCLISVHKAQETTQASAAWQVAKYDITASLSPTDRTLAAKASLTLKNVGKGAGSNVSLRISKKAEVASVKNANGDIPFTKSEDRVPNFQVLRVRLSQEVQPNQTVNFTVDYKISVGENSGVNAITPVNSQFLPILTTNSDNAALQLWYPTPTNPFSPRGGDFAPFSLTINADGNTIISSGKQSGNSFAQTLNALPFFVTGSYETVEGTGNNKGFSAFLSKGASSTEKKRAEDLMTMANAAKSFTADLLGTAPDVPIRLVAVRRGAGFADGGTILLDSAVFRREKLDAATAFTVAEAIAKVWLGNQTQIRGEGYGIIREGLARLIAVQFLEKYYGSDSAELERLRQRITYSNVAKRDLPILQASPLDDFYFASVPNKSAMIWRLVAKTLGNDKFFPLIRANLQSSPDRLTLANLRNVLNLQSDKVKIILDNELSQITDTDLLVGLPQLKGGETVAALRNVGSSEVTVNVLAITDKGERLFAPATVAAQNFSEVSFKTTAKVVKVEIDPEKLYPQIDYSNDIAPRESTGNDWQLEVSQSFVRQEFTKTESLARKFLQTYPRSDEARTWLGRALLAEDKTDEAEKEFRTALGEKLPTARTLAWANIGLGDIFSKRGKNAEASAFYDLAVKADVEYGANLAARAGRLKTETSPPTTDESVKAFFAQLDKAILTGRKPEIEAYIIPGEMTKFASGVAGGQPEQWQTKIIRLEQVDTNYMVAEVSLSLKRLSKEPESGTAVFSLAKTANSWKLSSIDLLEVK